MENNELLTTAEVMKLLKISRSTVVKLVKESKLISYKIGESVRFKKADIDLFLEASKVQETK